MEQTNAATINCPLCGDVLYKRSQNENGLIANELCDCATLVVNANGHSNPIWAEAITCRGMSLMVYKDDLPEEEILIESEHIATFEVEELGETYFLTSDWTALDKEIHELALSKGYELSCEH